MDHKNCDFEEITDENARIYSDFIAGFALMGLTVVWRGCVHPVTTGQKWL